MPPTVEGVGAAASGVAAITPAFPTPTGGFQDGDVIIGIGESVTDFPTAATNGFVHVGPGGSPAVQDTATRLTVIWTRWTAGLTAHSWGDSGDHNLGCYVVVRGCPATGDPWTAFAVGLDATLSTAATFPGVSNTVQADCLVLEIGGWSAAFGVAALPTNGNYTGIAERVDAVTTAGNDGGIFVASGVKATAGATGQTTATLGGTATKAMMTLALAPAPVGTVANAEAATLNLVAADAGVAVTAAAGAASVPLAAADAAVQVTGPEGAPDAILAATNLTGTVQALWDDPTAPDTTFLDPVDPAAATDLRVSFPTPTTAPGSGGPKTFQVWVYRTVGAGADPTVILDLWESGSFVAQLASVTVTITSGQLVTGTLNPALLSDPSGAGVELRIRGVPV